MLRTLPIIFGIFAFISCSQDHSRLADDETVSALIDQLASPIPAKYTNGAYDGGKIAPADFGGYFPPHFFQTEEKLIAMGTKIYPELAKHHDDSRYSCSWDDPAWWNETVGDVIIDIMANGVAFDRMYKGRDTPHGNHGYPGFGDMMAETGIEKYARHAQSRTKTELQKEYIEWHIQKEREIGFVSRTQESAYLEPYIERLKELER
ncbi:MAG TPA: hypothetical protein VFB72_09010 [Verrucomicrobiae bacterium]|nr:hypothetical protein [Verrucomicrobiae bacterium]